MSRLLPYPSKLADIQKIVAPMVAHPKEELWRAWKLMPSTIANYVRRKKAIGPGDEFYTRLNQYLFYRSCNQVNEACNKLWATTELFHHIKEAARGKGELLCKGFNPGFLPTSAVPTLYYANISAIISMLSVYGIGSLPGEKQGEYLNLVRAEEGFVIRERNSYNKEMLGVRTRGWHEGVFAAYRALVQLEYDIPKIDTDAFQSLQRARGQFDYAILAHTTMEGAFGEQLYFKHLPHVGDVILSAVGLLQKLRSELPNGCEKRFDQLLLGIIPLLYDWGQKPLADGLFERWAKQ